ncbi:hypothetical protein HMPREF3214_01236 [Alloscardovia omnicolens]|nr:hypothetical protein HMPREF3214_01236 [Alloscardovia omnicolens]
MGIKTFDAFIFLHGLELCEHKERVRHEPVCSFSLRLDQHVRFCSLEAIIPCRCLLLKIENVVV